MRTNKACECSRRTSKACEFSLVHVPTPPSLTHFYLDKGTPMGINTSSPRRTGGHTPTTRQSTPNTINIEAYIRQDKPPDIDIRDTPGSTLSGTFRGRPQGSSTVSNFVGCELEEEGYPVVDYESDRQTAISTTVR
uniref:Ulp1 protease-like n=1 Tax=Oryza sativa subsp. japonica TaxID=39947 RepID=Q6YXT0_ORYSJ|nr:hypothetical protein [Oryza sativa Japonica Group]